MKHFTFKWLKRLYIVIAVNLVLIALLLSTARILFISVQDYKQQAIDWLTEEYQVAISVEDISAGIDFSGMVLTLNNVELLDTEDLPFELKFKYLFLHIDFWDSVTARKLHFTNISLQGADFILDLSSQKSAHTEQSEKSQVTVNKLENIFLTRLKKFSVRDSTFNFTDKYGINKLIIIEQLRWLNEDDDHQGIGQASFPNALGKNELKFVIDLFPKSDDKPLSGDLYLQADNIDIKDYLLEQANSNAKVIEAVVGFDAWAKFSGDTLDSVQVKFKHNQFSWSMLDENYNWGLNGGSLQLTNSDKGWLVDSYDLVMTHNYTAWEQLSLSGKGDNSSASVDFNNLTIKHVLPFYLLHSDLSAAQINFIRQLDVDAHIDQIGLSLNEQSKFQFALKLHEFKNRPVGAIPGISNGNITLQGDIYQGRVEIGLAKQKIYFDGQFSRSMPVKSGDIDLRWLQTDTGLQLFSKSAQLNTDELDTLTDFSILFPNEKAQNQSAFLSLYTYASLNDASKAQYYFPVKAMGDSVFDYLQPTIQKGHVKGAKILWYGAFNHYPYGKHNGIFQAWVPLRDAQYDFYGDWEGLTNLDLDLLFENDYLLMDAKKANLGEIEVDKLSAKVDHLNPNGILTIKADISEDAYKINNYLKASPLKDSVGKALSVINVAKPLSGNIILTVPFNREILQTKSEGHVLLKDNTLDLQLADDLPMPLSNVNGSFDFINGNLTANNISASLFDQAVDISFTTEELEDKYQVDVQTRANWDMAKLSQYRSELLPGNLSGNLDWSGKVSFTHEYSGGYQYNVALNSSTQGVEVKLPAPFYKNPLQSWPTAVTVSGDDSSTRMVVTIKDKLAFDGELNYASGEHSIPYFNLNIGQSEILYLNKSKQVINVNLDNLNIDHWYDYWLVEEQKAAQHPPVLTLTQEPLEEISLIKLDEVDINVKHLNIFNQPLTLFRSKTTDNGDHWQTDISSDNLQTNIEYRPGIPARFDVVAKKVNLQHLDVNLFKDKQTKTAATPETKSENLRDKYPEIFIECETCIYKEINLSPLSAHVYPTKKRLNIDHIKIGGDTEFTNISGFWDQRLTNIIFDIEGDKKENLIERLGFESPLYYKKGQVSGAVNWIGAPWQANFESLNGALSAQLKDGAITEVSDKGTRLLSVFSLDGIRRSLNIEFDNVFAKGFNFDELTFTGNIDDGVIHNDDFYLEGSAGKIIGDGVVDMTAQKTDYHFSYSPAVTSSLPVLAAFAINPLTGAAVLMITKLLEPVVDSIIRVDFSVKGDLSNPTVKLESRKTGKVKLDNSEVLEEMSEQQSSAKDNTRDK
ncbi:DUF3971 domain-containing protein [Psychromonas marina]|uniref:DUF3971 domain-containing protein n=1 Tax=Psychromonas marina TaxID=88364 RepID=A0ABQ6DXE6_9GAMM|nr:YhdP family protein [Psychromonas marina]GLS89812.1 DUF3971 domain-containing protein [Psychromonas marina]